jgi:hypothetical protein
MALDRKGNKINYALDKSKTFFGDPKPGRSQCQVEQPLRPGLMFHVFPMNSALHVPVPVHFPLEVPMMAVAKAIRGNPDLDGDGHPVTVLIVMKPL